MLVSQFKESLCVREIPEDSSQQILRNKKHEKTEEYKITQHGVVLLTSTDRVIKFKKKLVRSGVELALE